MAMAVRLVSISSDLHSLCNKGDLKTMTESWSKYSDQLEVLKSGFTPLQEAARKGYSKIIDFLLSREANVNALSSKGETALFYAAKGRHTKCEILLLDGGADVTIGEITPLGTADKDFLNFLIDKDSEKSYEIELVNRALEGAMKLEKVNLLEKIVLLMPTNLEKVTSEAESKGRHQSAAFLLLVQAAIKNDLELVERLYSTNKTGNALPSATRKIASTISTRVPLTLAKRLKNASVFDLILTKTGSKASKSSIDVCWDNLEVDHLSQAMLSRMLMISYWSLSHNKLCSLDCYGVHLAKLKVLDASHNQISSVDPDLFEMPRLISLNLSHNQLTSLPKFKRSRSLARLDLSYNMFDQVPYSLVNCPSLAYLNLSYNEIMRLPEWLASVETLEDVRLEGVPLVKTDDKKDFLKTKQLLKVKLDNASKVNEMKVIVAGPSRNGKMHFVSYICNDECEKDDVIRGKARKVFVKRSSFKNSDEHADYNFNVWEICGLNSDMTVPIERLLYTKCAIYVLVFDIGMAEKEISKLWVWVDAISAHASPSCVLFVGFDSGTASLEVQHAKSLLMPLIKHFSNVLIFCEPVMFSLSKNSSLDKAHIITNAMHQTALLLECADGQPYIGRLVRNTAVAFKEEIDLLGKKGKLSPVLLLEGMEALTSHFKNFQIREPKEIAKISAFLNEVGVILSFSPSSVPFQFLCVCDLDWFLEMILCFFDNLHVSENAVPPNSNIHSSLFIAGECTQQKLLSCSIFLSSFNKSASSSNQLDVTSVINGITSVLADYKLLLPVRNNDVIRLYLPSFHLPACPSQNILDLLPNATTLHTQWRYSPLPFLSRRNWINVLDTVLSQIVYDNDITAQVWRDSIIFPDQNLAVVYTEQKSILLLSPAFSKFFKQVKRTIAEAVSEAVVDIMCPKCLKEGIPKPAKILLDHAIESIISAKGIVCQQNHKLDSVEIVPHLIVASSSLNVPSCTLKEEGHVHQNVQLGPDTVKESVKLLKNESDFESLHDRSILLKEFCYPSISSSEGMLIKLSLQENKHPLQAAISYIPSSLGSLAQLSESASIGTYIPYVVVYRIAIQLAYALSVAPSLSMNLENFLIWSFDAESAFNCSFVVDNIHDSQTISSKRRFECWRFHMMHFLKLCKATVSKSSGNTLMASYHVLEELLYCKQMYDLDWAIVHLSKVHSQLLSCLRTTSCMDYCVTTTHCVTKLSNMDELQTTDSDLLASNEIWLPLHCSASKTMKMAIFNPSSMILKSYPVRSLEPKVIIAVNVCSAGNVWVSTMAEDGLSCLSIFDVHSRTVIHNVKMKNNAFTCLIEYNASERMYLGTKAGFIFDFASNVEKIKANHSKPRHKRVSESPIVSLAIIEKTLWVSTADNHIYLLQCSPDLGTPVLKEFWTNELKNDLVLCELVVSSDSNLIYSYAKEGRCIWLLNTKIQEHSETVAYYNDSQNSIELEELLKPLSLSHAFVSVLVEANGCLWVGLSTGHILIFHRDKLLYHMQPYKSPVISLCTLQYSLSGSKVSCVLSCGKDLNSMTVSGNTEEISEDVLMLWVAPTAKVLSQMLLLEKSCGHYLDSYQSLADMIHVGGFTIADQIPLKLDMSHNQHFSQQLTDASRREEKPELFQSTLQVKLKNEKIVDIQFFSRPTFQCLFDKLTSIVDGDAPSSLQIGYRLGQHEMLVSLSNDSELDCYLQLSSKPPLILI